MSPGCLVAKVYTYRASIVLIGGVTSKTRAEPLNMAKKFIPLEAHVSILERHIETARERAERFRTYSERQKEMAERENDEWREEIAFEQEGMAQGFERTARDLEKSLENDGDETYEVESLGRQMLSELLILIRKYPEMRSAITDYTLVTDYDLSVEEVAELRDQSQEKIERNVDEIKELSKA